MKGTYLKKQVNNINFEEVLSNKRTIVWSEIERYFNHFLIPSINKYSPKYKKLADFHRDLIIEYPKRKGKYLRPALILLTAEAMGVPPEHALKTAAAMQVSEDWILIHDDWEDGSLVRRGSPALHHLFSPELAVNAGDTLHILMWKILHDNIDLLGENLTKKLFDEFFQMLVRTTFGQTVEIKWSKENNNSIKDEDWFFVADGKTSYYTIAGPMRLGAILGSASDRQLELLFEFGTYLGRCFQIQDDILDLTSDFRGLKKQIGNDIYEGKKTLMLGHLLRSACYNDRKKIENIMAKTREDKTDSEVLWIIEAMHRYQSIKYAQKIAAGFSKRAKKMFKDRLTFLKEEPFRSQLEAGIAFILERDH